MSYESLTPSPRGGRLASRLRKRAGALCNRRLLRFDRLSLLLGLGRALPVIQHLGGQYHVQSKSGDEAVQDELVIDLLQGGEDARKRSSEVVEYLDTY